MTSDLTLVLILTLTFISTCRSDDGEKPPWEPFQEDKTAFARFLKADLCGGDKHVCLDDLRIFYDGWLGEQFESSCDDRGVCFIKKRKRKIFVKKVQFEMQFYKRNGENVSERRTLFPD